MFCDKGVVCACFLGVDYCGPPGDLDQEPDEAWVKSLKDEGLAYQEWDEDADVDESGKLSVFSPGSCSPGSSRSLCNPLVRTSEELI